MGFRILNFMIADLKFAFRQLRKSPGFSALAIITLATVIGMNTAIFSILHDVFVRGLPFNKPSRLVRIYSIYGEDKVRNIEPGPISVPKYLHYRQAQTVFSEMAADTFDTAGGYVLTGLGEPVYLNGSAVTANYFQLLGVKPIMGRLFLPEEEMKADVALVSEPFWRSRLGSNPNVIGRSITLNGTATTIVGVIPTMPLAWFGPQWEVWTAKPFALPSQPQEAVMRLGLSFLRVVGRLKPGVTLDQAKGAMAAAHASYREQNGAKRDAFWPPYLVTVPEDATGHLRPALITLFAATALLLIIALSNVANLLLVRFTGRTRETALRIALGASRSAILRLFVLESTLLSLIAGAAGICVALWGLPLLPKIAGRNVPIEIAGSLQWPVLGFCILLSLLTGAVIGAYPALQRSGAQILNDLKNSGRGMGAGTSQHRTQRLLVGAQVCLAVLLLSGASLLIASFVRLSQQNAGFQADNIWAAVIPLPPTRYPDPASWTRVAKNLEDELRTVAGFELVSISEAMPLTGAWHKAPYARDDDVWIPMNERPLAFYHNISPNFLRTLDIRLVAGRAFTERDNAESAPVILISQSTAKRLFGSENPLGHHLYFGSDNGIGILPEIVGVAVDIRFLRLDKADDAEIYRPFAQQPSPFLAVAVRGNLGVDAIAGAVRRAVNKIDADLPLIRPRTMTQVMSNSLGQQRLTMTLLSIFAAVALLLAMIGVYGAVAHTVAQRTGEIGVRMALGAQTADVLRLVVRQGMLPAMIGLGVGMAAALALGRLLTTQLYQVSPHNPLLLLTTAIILGLVALIACLFPARRATQVDPIQALRAE
jgi:predicted permease